MCNFAKWFFRDVLWIKYKNYISGSLTFGWFLKLFDIPSYNVNCETELWRIIACKKTSTPSKQFSNSLPVHLPACLPKCTESAHTAHLVALMFNPMPHLCGMLCFIRCLRCLLPIVGVCGGLRLLLEGAGPVRLEGLGWLVGDMVMAERRRWDWGVAGGWSTVYGLAWTVWQDNKKEK